MDLVWPRQRRDRSSWSCNSWDFSADGIIQEIFHRLLAATLGALMTTWATFTPCFLWIFLGAPYIEKLRGKKQLTAALTAVTAAVVGVILNLAVWFGIHVMFPSGHFDLFAAAVCVIAFVGMLRWKWDIILVIIGSGLAGLVFKVAIPH